MSLFGAATSGVDPKSGSYLSKEDRIAMFRASRGQSNSGGSSSVKSSGARVSPKSAIVVANKFSEITKTLNTNYQTATQNVAQQVEKNRRNIENLYQIINNKREQELKEEKAETRSNELEFEKRRRGLREGLVEGFSSAVAAIAKPIQKVASGVANKAKGIWDNIVEALLALSAAWVIDNFSGIKSEIENFLASLPELKTTIVNNLFNIRGLFSIFDAILKKIVGTVWSIGRTAFNVGRRIVSSVYRVSKNVFTSIGNFVKRIFAKIIPPIKNAVSAALKKLKDILGQLKEPAKRALNWVTEQGKKIFNKVIPKPIQNLIKSGKEGISNLTQKGIKGLEKIGGNIKGSIESVKNTLGSTFKPSNTQTQAKWIENALKPLSALKPLKGLVSKIGGLALGAVKRVPFLGMAVDILINKNVSGQDWSEAILRGILSGGAGAIGAVGGAKTGALLGAGLGSVVPGLGTAIGGVIGAGLGGVIGSMVAGAIGDKVGAMSYEKFTGLSATENKPIEPDKALDKLGAASQSALRIDASPAIEKAKQIVGSVTGGSSTPSGLNMPESSMSSTEVSITDLPPQVINKPKEKTDKPNTIAGQQNVPIIRTSNPITSAYRRYAAKQFQLVGEY